jgi:hypothetical protein
MTKDVGTVHYMAPEISTGNYNRQIDIYAAGILLYEMLTGHVPFEGESAAEILMKHMTTPPDLTKVPKEFVPILEKALTKNPANRYQTITEMAKEVAFVINANDAWRDSPRKLTQAPKPALADLPMAIPVTPTMIFQQRWSELTGILLWAVVIAAIFAVGWVLLFGGGNYDKLTPIFFMVTAISWSVLIPNKLWPPTAEEDNWTRRLLLMSLGFLVALLGLWLDGYQLPLPWTQPDQLKVLQPWQPDIDGQEAVALRQSWLGKIYPANTSMPVLACYLSYFGLMFLVLRWWKSTEPTRAKRFSIKPIIAVAFWAYLLLFLLPTLHHREIGFVSLVMASAVVQVTCPWKEKPATRKQKKLRLATA